MGPRGAACTRTRPLDFRSRLVGCVSAGLEISLPAALCPGSCLPLPCDSGKNLPCLDKNFQPGRQEVSVSESKQMHCGVVISRIYPANHRRADYAHYFRIDNDVV